MNMREPQSRMDDEQNNFLGFPIRPKTVVILFFTLIAVLAVVFVAQAVAPFDLRGGGNMIKVPGDYTTIQAAINAAGTGDIIQVRTGGDNERLTISKPGSRGAEFCYQI